MATIHVELREVGFTTRRTCVLCGDATEKTNVIAEADGVGIVCERCLERGPDMAGEVLESQAQELERRAAEVRELAEAEWEMPTITEFRQEEQVAEALFVAERMGWNVNHAGEGRDA